MTDDGDDTSENDDSENNDDEEEEEKENGNGDVVTVFPQFCNFQEDREMFAVTE